MLNSKILNLFFGNKREIKIERKQIEEDTLTRVEQIQRL